MVRNNILQFEWHNIYFEWIFEKPLMYQRPELLSVWIGECMITEHFLQPRELRHFSSMKYAPRSVLSTRLFVREKPVPVELARNRASEANACREQKSPFPVCTLPPEILSKAKGKKLKRETKGKEQCRIVLTITGACIVRTMSQFENLSERFDVCCWTGSSFFFF